MQTNLGVNYNMTENANALATQIAGLLALAQCQTATQPTRLGVVESQSPEHESRA
jgi:hypothetical protein